MHTRTFALCAALLVTTSIARVAAAETRLGLASVQEFRTPAPVASDTCKGSPNCMVAANAGPKRVILANIPVLPGDVLHLVGELEWTSEYPQVVGGTAVITVDGKDMGWPATGYAHVAGNHHQVLKPEAIYTATEARTARVELRFSASRSDASPLVAVNFGAYTSLIASRYSRQAVAPDAPLRFLKDARVFTQQLVTSFGIGAAFKPFQLLRGVLPVEKGDIALFSSQSTSRYRDAGIDMQGAAIRLDTPTSTPISTWATSNTPYEMQTMPLHVDAQHVAKVDGELKPLVTVHGVNGKGALVAPGGYLQAMRFGAERADAPGRELAEARTARMPAPKGVKANAGEVLLLEEPLAVQAGDVLRASVGVQLWQPSGFTLPVSCTVYLRVVREGGSVVASSYASQYTSVRYASIHLRTAVLTPIDSGHSMTLRVLARCNRQDASPMVPARAATAGIMIYR